jgi:hypothetical protein
VPLKQFLQFLEFVFALKINSKRKEKPILFLTGRARRPDPVRPRRPNPPALRSPSAAAVLRRRSRGLGVRATANLRPRAYKGASAQAIGALAAHPATPPRSPPAQARRRRRLDVESAAGRCTTPRLRRPVARRAKPSPPRAPECRAAGHPPLVAAEHPPDRRLKLHWSAVNLLPPSKKSYHFPSTPPLVSSPKCSPRSPLPPTSIN